MPRKKKKILITPVIIIIILNMNNLNDYNRNTANNTKVDENTNESDNNWYYHKNITLFVLLFSEIICDNF